MDPNEVAVARIHQAKYLYLRSIRESGRNGVEILIEEATQSAKLPVPGCLTFRLYWKRYAAYVVTEEMVGCCGNEPLGVFEGRLFRSYSSSLFLDYLSKSTGAHLKPLIHYGIVCLDHWVDVAAEEPPEIEIITPMNESRIQ